MKLKDYQETVLKKLKDYLESLADFRDKYDDIRRTIDDDNLVYDFPKLAFKKVIPKAGYHSKTNGLDQPLPDVYLKVPTGGGKTLLACHSIDLIHHHYLERKTGLVLWIVPSNQIYKQTINALKDRDHPYRQILDRSSGGRTIIKQKMDLFTKADVEQNLVVLMLMLPSASRQSKETLKLWRDRGGFSDFFPNEDDFPAQEELLKANPNLDCFTPLGGELKPDSKEWINMRQIKTSLGNTLRLLKPLIIIDEGQKAYSALARKTVEGFNPSFVLELSATLPEVSNKLVEITGKELNAEQMIKLDIHLFNKVSTDWKDTMLASVEKRKELERIAKDYEGNTGEYIRPICLIQAERTGRHQRGSGFIHSEGVKEFLIKQCAIPEHHIAIKSSEKDDIEGIDLLSRSSDIRFIITKQALQEGWDCSFAYILTILTNPGSATGITQLVGRILRQPFARKTKIKELDECYVMTFRPNAGQLVTEIKNGLEGEGLGDLAGRIVGDEGVDDTNNLKDRELKYREGFRQLVGKIFLPKFVLKDGKVWRDVKFENDILSGVDWDEIDISAVGDLALDNRTSPGEIFRVGMSEENGDEHFSSEKEATATGTLEVDEVFLTRQITDFIPNPWIGYEIGVKALKILRAKFAEERIAGNFVFIIEELKKILESERNRLAEKVFRKMIEDETFRFFIIEGTGGYVLPSKFSEKSNKKLNRADGTQLVRSLLDYVPDENINELERDVALYLDEQEKLLWWFRNMSRHDYFIQGWRKHKIFPDFIAAETADDEKDDYGKVWVFESKGEHLKNDDTDYKQHVFNLCNEVGVNRAGGELIETLGEAEFGFQLVYGDQWRNEMNKIFEAD